MALLRGALRSMRQSQIDLLVVGLPVALFAVKKAALERVMTGEHDVGGGKKVSVVRTLAVAQPQGALASEHICHGCGQRAACAAAGERLAGSVRRH